jgi:hypothetical protein
MVIIIVQACFASSKHAIELRPHAFLRQLPGRQKKFKKKSRFKTDRQFVSDIKGRKIATTTTGKMTKLLLLSFFLSAILVLDSISARIAPFGLEELESNDIEEVKRDDGVFDATALVRFKNL